MTIRVIDLETTGVDPAQDRIVEIAALDIVKMNGRHEPANVRQHLINPGIPIPAQASAVHHITDGHVATAQTFDRVFSLYTEHNDDRLILVAHNAGFEREFLTQPLEEREVIVDWVCTYKVALRVWPDLPSHSNQFLRYHLGFIDPFGIPSGRIHAHRALGDCYVTGCIFLALLQRASFADMLTWSAEPALYTSFRFGKHKGVRFDAVPRDYLEWIVNKSDMDDDVKFSARHWLTAAKVTA